METMRLIEKAIDLAKSQKINQRELATMVGVDPARLSEWKRDQGKPSIDVALRIARTLGTTLDYLADDTMDAPATVLDPTVAIWERKVREIIAEIGPERAWRRLVGFEEVKAEIEPPKTEAPSLIIKQRSKAGKSKPGSETA